MRQASNDRDLLIKMVLMLAYILFNIFVYSMLGQELMSTVGTYQIQYKSSFIKYLNSRVLPWLMLPTERDGTIGHFPNNGTYCSL